MNKFLMVSAALVTLTLSAQAHAANSGGVQVNGYVLQYNDVANAYNESFGNNSVARQQIGIVENGVTIDGALYQGTRVTGTSVNVAAGANAKAVTSIGSVHKGTVIKGTADLYTQVGNSTNIAYSNTTACMQIGGLGEVDCD